YNILLLHQPEQFPQFTEKFDLILSGHAHGGQWRFPVILEQGLYAPNQGLFPDYTNGQYEYADCTHIISRGLARPLRMIFIPRIFNRPEISVIDIYQ
ncbi:MAG: phosphoesterase, partial [Ruminococcus sp.]|nr:phosphoesterase [Ruminococcus sp.]